VADYPFTTLEPHLGVVRRGDTEFVVADIPGLIEGASEGKGLGHQFLRHIERARAIVVLVDLASIDEREEPAEQERVLLQELGRYRPEMLERPRVTVGTKADMAVYDWDGMRISAITGTGVDALVNRMAELVQQARAEAPEPDTYVVHRPMAEGITIERADDGSLVVRGRAAERAVALNDLTNLQAMDYVQHRLKRLGVDRALARFGAREGDTVRIGKFEFEYQPS
jgi:GTP-binding protein